MNTSINTLKSQIAAADASIAANTALAEQYRAMVAAVSELERQQRNRAIYARQLAEAEKAEEIRKELAASITILAVTTPPQATVTTTRTVIYTKRVNGLYGPEMQEGKVVLHGMSREVQDALLAKPELIPADILALHSDPAEAIGLHTGAVRRGYLIG